jgi:hypothetical protein
MARPQANDDRELLLIMAELLAFPQVTGVTQPTEAARRAVSFILESERWHEHARRQVIDRLLKAWRSRSEEFIAEAARRDRPFFRGPLLPTLINLPEAPQDALRRSVAQDLRNVSRWAAEWAAHLEVLTGEDTRRDVEIGQSVIRAVEAALRINDRTNSPS